ncbi:MAG: hypothetical protein JNL97_06515 [Verrucomicrobiales bacterium]|nr:hypothetical protein [Verrucomicrobiales bacterium]
MNAILICPADRPDTSFLARSQPLALVPILGRPILDLWLAEVAARGARTVRVLAADRPDQIRRYVRKGEAWGIKVEVVPEQRESTVDEARSRHASFGTPSDEPPLVATLDHIPPDGPRLWDDVPRWFAALKSHFEAAARDRIGIRQPIPGAYVDARARLSPDAILRPPCWIGAHSWVGPRAVVGPDAVVEAHSYVDDAAEVVDSFVGPGTYVGALTEIRESVAWKRDLYKIPNGSAIQVPDDFLLGPVQTGFRGGQASSPAGRLLALLAIILTSPILLYAWFRREPGKALFATHAAVRAPASEPALAGTVTYYRLRGVHGLLARWPELWTIVRGHFRWVGNRPLTPSEAESLTNEYERLWLGVPTGLFSLADAEGCADAFGDDARAHSSFFAVHSDWRQRLAILRRILFRRPEPQPSSAPIPS